MESVEIVTGLAFDNRPQATIILPKEVDGRILERSAMLLRGGGLSIRPGYIEKLQRHCWYVEGAAREDILREHITDAFPEEVALTFRRTDEPAPPIYTGRFAEFMHDKAPAIYNHSARTAGSLYAIGALGILKSTHFDEQKGKEGEGPDNGKRWLKRLAVGTSMSSALVTMLYGDEPLEQRDIHDVLKAADNHYREQDWPQPETVLEEKDSPLARAHNYTRRLPWAVSGALNLTTNVSRVFDQLLKRHHNLGTFLELCTSAVFTVASLIRTFVPQHGGQRVTKEHEASESELKLRDKVSHTIEALPGGERLNGWIGRATEHVRKAPLSVSGDIANVGQVLNMTTGVVKGDSGLGLRAVTSLAGNTVKKISNKKLGIGFDQLVTAAADFIHKWDYPEAGTEQKVKLLCRFLGKQPEIFHTPEAMEEGIAARLRMPLTDGASASLSEVLAQDTSPEQEKAEATKSVPYLPREREWVSRMPVDLLGVKDAMRKTPERMG